jgi:hypothetical protein
MKIVFFLLLTGCSTNEVDLAKKSTLNCVKDLLQYEVSGIDAYKICKDIDLKKSKILR